MHYEYYNDADPLFVQVLSSEGKSIWDNGGNGKEQYYDSLFKREITREYINKKLTNSYFEESSGKRIYQFCERNARLKSVSELQQQVAAAVRYPLTSLRQYHNGYVLLRCVVEPNGRTSKLEIVKGLDEECDKNIMTYFTMINRFRNWKPGKAQKVQIAQEVIIPILFSIKSFSRQENLYSSNYWNNSWNDQWMRQNMMRPPVISAPNFK